VHVFGKVIETHYTNDILFSTKPVCDVHIFYNNEIVAVSNLKGEYSFCLDNYGYYTFTAKKNGYLEGSRSLYINNKKNGVDFRLERKNEVHHGWSPFPATTNGPILEVTGEGLCLYSRGGMQIYATKTVRVQNNKNYAFSAKVLKDKSTKQIYFGIQPLIKDSNWVYQLWNLDGWRSCLIHQKINDTTIIDSIFVDKVGYLYVYPDSVDVVLKIGADYNDFPVGYFTNIVIKKEEI